MIREIICRLFGHDISQRTITFEGRTMPAFSARNHICLWCGKWEADKDTTLWQDISTWFTRLYRKTTEPSLTSKRIAARYRVLEIRREALQLVSEHRKLETTPERRTQILRQHDALQEELKQMDIELFGSDSLAEKKA